MTTSARILSAVATAAGTSGPSGDASYVHVLADGTTAACVVDGIGHSPRIGARAALLAEVGARIGATRGPLHGLLTAAELIADPGPDDCPEEDAVAVAAVLHPGGEVQAAWTGDCVAWSWDPATGMVTKLTSDQTMGAFLRRVHPGGPAAGAAHYDDWVRVSLARSSVATVREAEAPARLVALLSDGAHGPLGDARVEALIGAAGADRYRPQVLADRILHAALGQAHRQPGARDDATVVILALTT